MFLCIVGRFCVIATLAFDWTSRALAYIKIVLLFSAVLSSCKSFSVQCNELCGAWLWFVLSSLECFMIHVSIDVWSIHLYVRAYDLLNSFALNEGKKTNTASIVHTFLIKRVYSFTLFFPFLALYLLNHSK